jgi:phage tail sheath gpL-like
MPSIIATSNKVPGVYTKVSLGVGQRSPGENPRHVVLVGNKTSAGTATVATEYDVFSIDDARTLFGAGSELFTLAKAALAANPEVTLKAMAIAEAAGTAGSGTLAFTGPATAAGTVYVSVMGDEIEVPYASGDANTAIAAAVEAAIDDMTDWPVTASVSTSTVTVTSKQLGPRNNFISLRARVTAGTGVGVTPPAGGYLTSGATADDPQTVLDTLAAVNRRYIVAPYSDATQLAKFATHVEAQDEPEVGHRRSVIWGSLDTLANTTTVATGLNKARMQCAWQENSDLTPGMLAAGVAAYRAGAESTDVATNFDGAVIPGFKAHYTSADKPLNSELVSALNNGITPLQTNNSGEVFIVRAVTCKSQDGSGNPDYRVLDVHKVMVADEAADRFELEFADRFGGFKADNDSDDEAPLPGVVTPALCRDLAFEILTGMEEDALLARGTAEARKDEIVFTLNTGIGRFDGVLPIDCIELAHQFCTDLRQIG